MSDAGVSASALAAAMTLSYQAVKKVLDGKTRSFTAQNNSLAASILGINPDWLASGIGDKRPDRAPGIEPPLESNVLAVDDGDPMPENVVLIKEFRVHFSAGPGRSPTYDEITESQPVPYLRTWMAREQIPPSKARRFKVKGDSMAPTLFSGDIVLVNTAETSIIDGKVYAIRYQDDLRVKRLYKRLNGGLILHSDNPEHRPIDEELTPEQVAEHIGIIGRVRDKSGAGGL